MFAIAKRSRRQLCFHRPSAYSSGCLHSIVCLNAQNRSGVVRLGAKGEEMWFATNLWRRCGIVGYLIFLVFGQVVAATHAPIEWDIVDNIKDKITPEAVESLKRTGVGIKGQFRTAIGRNSLPSINMELRKSLNLYANVMSAKSFPGPCAGRSHWVSQWCVSFVHAVSAVVVVLQACRAVTRMWIL